MQSARTPELEQTRFALTPLCSNDSLCTAAQALLSTPDLPSPCVCSVLALLETTSFAVSLAGPILIALVGFTIFAAEVRIQDRQQASLSAWRKPTPCCLSTLLSVVMVVCLLRRYMPT